MSNYYLIILFAASLVGVECRPAISSNFIQADDGSEATKYDFASNVSTSNDSDDWVNLTNVDGLLMNNNPKKDPEQIARVITSEGPIVDQSLDKSVTTEANTSNWEGTTTQWFEQMRAMLESSPSGGRVDQGKSNRVNHVGQTESNFSDENRNFILIDGNNWLDDLRQFSDGEFVDDDDSEDNESHVKSRFDNPSTSHLPLDQSSEGTENDDKADQTASDELDDMMADFQNDVRGIQKYFGKLCRKHRTAS